MVHGDRVRKEGLQGGEHAETRAEDGDEDDVGGGDGFGGVGVVEGGEVLDYVGPSVSLSWSGGMSADCCG